MLQTPVDEMATQFAIDDPPLFQPRYNIAPTQSVAVVGLQPEPTYREVVDFSLGLSHSRADRIRPRGDIDTNSSLKERDTMAAKKRKPNAAFMKPMTPSATLGAVIGNKAMPRTEVTKKIWAYIKRKKFQDRKNRRMINADDALKAVFRGKKQVSMFEMTKLVSKHLK